MKYSMESNLKEAQPLENIRRWTVTALLTLSKYLNESGWKLCFSNCNSEISLKIGGMNLASRYSKSIQYSDIDVHSERSPARFLR